MLGWSRVSRCPSWVIRNRGDPAASPAMSSVAPKADQIPHRSETTLCAISRHVYFRLNINLRSAGLPSSIRMPSLCARSRRVRG
jgi:hypothetical protein